MEIRINRLEAIRSAKRAATRDLPAAPIFLAFTPAGRTVKMGAYSFTTASEKRTLLTRGVSACIALVVYSRETREGALAHIPTERTPLLRVLGKCAKNSKGEILR